MTLSKLPWYLINERGMGGQHDHFVITPDTKETWGQNKAVASLYLDDEHSGDNGKFIIKACNNHEKLLEVLNDLIKSINKEESLYSETYQSISKAKALLEEIEK